MFPGKSLWSASAFTLAVLLPLAASAQVEKISKSNMDRYAKALPEAVRTAESPALRAHLEAANKLKGENSDIRKVNAVRVADAVRNAKVPFTDAVFFSVPAMSENQRLPDLFPVDGQAQTPVRIIMAGNEYEPGSFVVYPLKDLGKVSFTLSEFKTADGKVFPKEDLDLKVVKVWYQNANGWYSYFGDTGLKLTPELLLNDEDLVKVDTKDVQNYARLTDPATGAVSYRWITPPLEFNARVPADYTETDIFQYMKEDFRDASEFRPVTLSNGDFKQFFLTAHTTSATAPGLYSGSVNMTANGSSVGSIPVTVKVLPFTLPAPKSYDLSKDYVTMFYNYTSFYLIMLRNGGNYELAQKQYLNTLKDCVKHNQMFHWIRGNPGDYEFSFVIDAMKKAGMRTDMLFGGYPRGDNPGEWASNANAIKAVLQKEVGHDNLYLGYGDEPGASWFIQCRPLFKFYQNEGFKFIIAANNQAFYAAGYFYDFFNTSHNPEDREGARKWNEVGKANVAWYATHHVGPENPAFNRRQYGITPYLAGYSATCNYAHHYGSWNDRSLTYKPMVFAYGSGDGVIDTIQWEGYREGLDDIRYATLLKTLAKEALESKNIDVRYAGGQALQLLAETKLDSGNLDFLRLEMIRHILDLRAKLAVK